MSPIEPKNIINKNICIIGRLNGVGINQDKDILTQELKPLAQSISFIGYREFYRLFSLRKIDIIIFLERIFPFWLFNQKIKILIPNQERFPHRLTKFLPKIHQIWCKTKHSKEIFSQIHPQTSYIGFRSKDQNISNIEKNEEEFFHLGGKSTAKGTKQLISLWGKNPQWKTLHLIWKKKIQEPLPKNIKHYEQFLPTQKLQKLQNQIRNHLCPSQMEGWGHYLLEAMSCEALILTLDGKPMNELIKSEYGILCPAKKEKPRHLGIKYEIHQEKLQTCIEEIIKMPKEKKQTLGKIARQNFLQITQNFKEKFTS